MWLDEVHLVRDPRENDVRRGRLLIARLPSEGVPIVEATVLGLVLEVDFLVKLPGFGTNNLPGARVSLVAALAASTQSSDRTASSSACSQRTGPQEA